MNKILLFLALTIITLWLSSCTSNSNISNDFLKENFLKWNIALSNQNIRKIPDFNVIASWSYIDEVVSINLDSNNIKELDWEKFKIFKNLNSIIISFNKITSIKWLEHLPNLKVLDLSKNKIKNISWIEKWVNIQELILNFNNISSIEKLYDLNSLTALHLAHNNLKDISGMEKLKNLKEIHLEYNQLDNIDNILNMWLLIITSAKNNLPEDLVKALNKMSLQNMKSSKN